MNDVRVIDADSAGGVTWEMTVTEYWSNVNGSSKAGHSHYLLRLSTSIVWGVLLILSF